MRSAKRGQLCRFGRVTGKRTRTGTAFAPDARVGASFVNLRTASQGLFLPILYHRTEEEAVAIWCVAAPIV
jgi:hypothetical protein